MVRPMVHSIKHYVQFPINSIATGVKEQNNIAFAVERTTANNSKEVAEGSTIKAVYIEMWLQNQGNLGEFIATITKDPEDGAGPTFTEMGNLFAYNNKKNILYTTQGLTPNDAISGPINIYRSWIKIPKSKQRFGLGDALNLSIANVSSNSLNRCGFATYKEYS